MWKYYWPMLRHAVNNYIKEYNVCLVLKIIRYKPYYNLQSLSVFIYYWKDLSIDFIISLLISMDWKGNSYDSIFVIINWLTKMIYYKPVKVIINAVGIVKVIINVVIRYHNFSDSIIINQMLLFISKFWLLLCYFLVSSGNSPSPSIHRQTIGPKGKIVQLKPISKLLSTSSKMIGYSFFS